MMTADQITTKQSLTFLDVLKFAAGYWFRQPKKFFFILVVLLVAAFLETYLPSALAAFLTAIQHHQAKVVILYQLGIFLGTYLAQALFFSFVYVVYNSFETNLFKSLV